MTVLRDISFLWSMMHIVLLFLMFFEPRFAWRITVTVSFLGMGLMLCLNALAVLWLESGSVMSVAFFTCTLPSLLMFFLLSRYRDGRLFFLFCLTDTTCFWLLQLSNFLDRLAGGDYVVLFFSRLLLFPAVELLLWRYLRRPYRELQGKLNRGWWLFAAVGAVYYLLIMCTAVPVDTPLPDAVGLLRIGLVMLLMPLTYLTIIHGLWRQMQIYESRWRLEVQRQDYAVLRQKLELGRIFRHDLRHHLTVLEGLLQQGDCGGARRYIGSLSGGLEELDMPTGCANPAVNAVLSAYLSQAASAGCSLDTRVRTPEALPYEETDLCVLLGNALENAIHACQELPEDQRSIRLELELSENQRLMFLVENPCPEPVAFGPDGLPAVTEPKEGHGLGLQSVRAVAEKYGGLFRCQWEEERFQLRAVLMPPGSREESRRKPRLGWSEAVLLALLFLVLLNCIPALAGALESIPILGAVFRAMDLRFYSLPFRTPLS
ncbi:MAG: GHKL domain-containing protein [Oscillibacter sp.]|nr:GHKL domain-containing protein [Oscillibacter sp.]